MAKSDGQENCSYPNAPQIVRDIFFFYAKKFLSFLIRLQPVRTMIQCIR